MLRHPSQHWFCTLQARAGDNMPKTVQHLDINQRIFAAMLRGVVVFFDGNHLKKLGFVKGFGFVVTGADFKKNTGRG